MQSFRLVTRTVRILDKKGEITGINHVYFWPRYVLFKPHLENLNP